MNMWESSWSTQRKTAYFFNLCKDDFVSKKEKSVLYPAAEKSNAGR